jgi:hypothetical protein
MPSKRTIEGSGDAGAGEAPAQRMKLGTEVVVAADEASRGQQHDLDFVGPVVPPPPSRSRRSTATPATTVTPTENRLVIYIPICAANISCVFSGYSPRPLIFLEYKSYGYVLSVQEIRVIKIR